MRTLSLSLGTKMDQGLQGLEAEMGGRYLGSLVSHNNTLHFSSVTYGDLVLFYDIWSLCLKVLEEETL